MARGGRLATDLWDAPSRARARLSAPPLAACSRLPRLEVTLRLRPLCPDLSGWSRGHRSEAPVTISAGEMRTGAIGHNGFKSDFDMGHGGFKQSGIGREGGVDGLLPFLESKAMLLDGPTAAYQGTDF